MKKLLFFSTIFALCLFLSVPIVEAAEFGGGDNFSLEEGKVIRDSLYVGAGTVVIRGTVEDDLIVGGGTITIEGDVQGDVMIGGGTITINGNVGDDVRIGGGLIAVNGKVGGDLIAGGGSIATSKDSTVSSDLLVSGGTVHSAGIVNGDAKISAGNLQISGTIKGNVESVTEEAPVISSTASIGGNFKYTSEDEAEIKEGANIEGEVNHLLPKVTAKKPERGALAAVLLGIGLAWKAIFLAAMFIAGVVLTVLLPKWSMKAANNVSVKPWLSLGWGFLLLIATPVAALILSITIIGLPLGIMIGALYGASLYISWIIVGRYAGSKIIGLFLKEGEPSPYWSLALGLFILALVMLIPIVSIFAYFIFVIAGLGAAVLAANDSYQEAKVAGRV